MRHLSSRRVCPYALITINVYCPAACHQAFGPCFWLLAMRVGLCLTAHSCCAFRCFGMFAAHPSVFACRTHESSVFLRLLSFAPFELHSPVNYLVPFELSTRSPGIPCAAAPLHHSASALTHTFVLLIDLVFYIMLLLLCPFVSTLTSLCAVILARSFIPTNSWAKAGQSYCRCRSFAGFTNSMLCLLLLACNGSGTFVDDTCSTVVHLLPCSACPTCAVKCPVYLPAAQLTCCRPSRAPGAVRPGGWRWPSPCSRSFETPTQATLQLADRVDAHLAPPGSPSCAAVALAS